MGAIGFGAGGATLASGAIGSAAPATGVAGCRCGTALGIAAGCGLSTGCIGDMGDGWTQQFGNADAERTAGIALSGSNVVLAGDYPQSIMIGSETYTALDGQPNIFVSLLTEPVGEPDGVDRRGLTGHRRVGGPHGGVAVHAGKTGAVVEENFSIISILPIC